MNVPSERPPATLYHYTDGDGLAGIIQGRALWATHIRHLNDESEVAYSRRLVGELADRLRPELGDDWAAGVVREALAALATAPTSPDTFVASLCDDGDNLSQWRGYAAQGSGYALGFDRETLWRVAQAQGFSLVRIIYNEGEQVAFLEKALREAIPVVAGWAADRSTAPTAIIQLLALGVGFTAATLAVKNPLFKDEKEWRVVRMNVSWIWEPQNRTRVRAGVHVPFEEMALTDPVTGDTPLTEIVLGPTVRSADDESEIRALLDANGFSALPIRKSLVPLRPRATY